jgi:lipoprotein signal peptidase
MLRLRADSTYSKRVALVAMHLSDRAAVEARGGSRRAQWAWLLASLSGVCAVALAVDAGVRQWAPDHESFWIVQPVVYIARGQNLDSPVALSLLGGGAALAFGVVLVRLLRRLSPRASHILELTAGLVLGGALANDIEIVVVGSVTDFLGIRGSGGIYSAGDLAIDFGLAISPLAAFVIAAPVASGRSAVLAGGGAYLTVIGIAIMNPRSFGVFILATAVVTISATVLYLRSRRAGVVIR